MTGLRGSGAFEPWLTSKPITVARRRSVLKGLCDTKLWEAKKARAHFQLKSVARLKNNIVGVIST